MKLTNILASLL